MRRFPIQLLLAFALLATVAVGAANGDQENSEWETEAPHPGLGDSAKVDVIPPPAAEMPGGIEAALAEIPEEAKGRPFASAGIPQKEFDGLLEKAELLIEQLEEGAAEASIKIDDIEGKLVVTVTSETDRDLVLAEFGSDPAVDLRYAGSIAISLAGTAGNDTDYEDPDWGHWAGAGISDLNVPNSLCTSGPVMEYLNGRRFGTTNWHCAHSWNWVYGANGGGSPEYYGQATYGSQWADSHQIATGTEYYDAFVHHAPVEPDIWSGLEVRGAYDTYTNQGQDPNYYMCHTGYVKHHVYPTRSGGRETGYTCDMFVSSSTYWYQPEGFPFGWWGATLTDPSIEEPCPPDEAALAFMSLGACDAATYHGDSGSAVYRFVDAQNYALIYGQTSVLFCETDSQQQAIGWVNHPCDTLWFTESSVINTLWNQSANGFATIATFHNPQTSW